MADGPRSLGLAPVLWSVEPAGVLASASSGLHDPVVQLAGCAVSGRDRSALTPPTVNEPGLAATRQPRQRCPGQVTYAHRIDAEASSNRMIAML
ncbi:hypothetical protein HPB52_020701 [Rhipicephalus sanguineus]|uniref:Uncharacterized protein n=1 Tax=Rhipicephalus sanguineus TaxID=34632 RepID=A0A9D4Q5A6_RHISA|nr:hypothetical protein HPB52_020701 [Rhipicephalus sanguineus]